MFAVRDKRSGKFLKAFSGSLNSHSYWGDTMAKMFTSKTPNDAKIYQTKSGATSAFYSYRYKKVNCVLKDPFGYEKVSLEEALPWVEIVPVKIVVDNKRK